MLNDAMMNILMYLCTSSIISEVGIYIGRLTVSQIFTNFCSQTVLQKCCINLHFQMYMPDSTNIL